MAKVKEAAVVASVIVMGEAAKEEVTMAEVMAEAMVELVVVRV